MRVKNRMVPLLLTVVSLAIVATARSPPPVASLLGQPLTPSIQNRDTPAITNFWGSVGSANDDVLGLSQVLLPPFVDVGVPTGRVLLAQPAPPCSPETTGPYYFGGSTQQNFFLVQANATMKLYNLTCSTSDCTSWHNATAVMPAPFTSFSITYQEIPPHTPFSDYGTFDASCTVVTFRNSGGAWCALGRNPSCTPVSPAVPLEGWQWSPVGTQRWGGPAATETRMLFEGAGVLQRLTVTAGDVAPLPGLAVELTGAMRAYPGGLSWTTGSPMSTAGFNANLTTVGSDAAPVLLTCDAQSAACAAWVLCAADVAGGASADANITLAAVTATLQFPQLPPGASITLSLALVVAADAASAMLLAGKVASAQSFSGAWDGFAEGWQERWQDAFTPKVPGGPGHFSGSLPVLYMDESVAGTALQRTYYMGVLAILQAERTNLPALAPRVYVTGTGNTLCGMEIGGTMQFAWDQTFYATLAALLDPEAVRADLSLWVGQPIAKYFGVELDNLAVGGDFYAFNALSLYRAFSAYLRVTNDTAFLSGPAGAYLDTLADFYLPYVADPSTSTLADYSGNPNNYLECVPTYCHVTAGLQAGNAFMAQDLADLRAAQGNATGAAALRARAGAIATETLARLYVSSTSGARNGTAPGDVGGWWRVLDTSAGGAATEVRHVVDFDYAALGFASPRWCGGSSPAAACVLNASVASQMVDFALRQLVVPGSAWMRALSVLDGAAPVSRPDHGSTGAYDAWPAMAFDAMTVLDAGFTRSVPFLAAAGGASTAEGPFGQAHGIADDGVSVFKTTGGCTRGIANNGGAFAESILRLLFGYDPAWFAAAPGTPTPLLPGVPRGISGVMSCIRGPGSQPQYLTATLDAAGSLSWNWTAQCA